MNAAADQERATLLRYLLGELPEEERERIEERYMVDEQFGELLDELEADLVDAYVENSLPAEQRRHFETCFLVTRERKAAVQAAFLSKVYRQRVAEPAQARPYAKRRFTSLAAALAIAMIGVGVWFLFDRREAKHELTSVTQKPLVRPPAAKKVTIQPETATKIAAPQRTIAAINPPDVAVATGGHRQAISAEPPSLAASDSAPAADTSAAAIASAPLPSAPMMPPIPVTSAVRQRMKERVIVDDFDYSTVTTAVQAVFGTQQNIGEGIRARLSTQLSQDGKVVVVERGKIDTLMKEQDRDAGNRVKQGTGARVGRLSGADALLTGDIVIFGRDDKKTKVAGGAIFGSVGGGIAKAHAEDKAVVAIDYRIIDAETGEVIATGEAKGESIRRSKGWGGLAGALGKGATGTEVDMSSSSFDQTVIGEAVQDCVNKLAAILNTQIAALKKAPTAVEALVADIYGNTMVISAGTDDGVNSGDVFEVLRVVREVKDPRTHEVLDRITEKVGELTIVSVRDKIATGNYVGSAAQVDFVVRKKI